MALTNREASIVLGMAARGDPEHRIAAWFDVNQGRIAEIKAGAYGSIQPAQKLELPPTGALVAKARRLRAYAIDALNYLNERKNEGIGDAIKELEAGLKRFDADES